MIAADDNLVTDHVATLENLIPGTTYFFTLGLGAGSDGNQIESKVQFFKTTGASAPRILNVDMPAPGSNSTRIECSANRDVFWALKYGLYSEEIETTGISGDPGSVDVAPEEQSAVSTAHFKLTDLRPGTRYYFTVTATDSDGNTADSGLLGFDTARVNHALFRPATGSLGDMEKQKKNKGKQFKLLTDGDENCGSSAVPVSCNGQAGQWLQVDLESVLSPAADLVMTWCGNHAPSTFFVSTSIDGKKWTPYEENANGAVKPVLSEKTSETGSPLLVLSFSNLKNAKFIKLFFQDDQKGDSDISNTCNLSEVKVFQSESAQSPIN